jgi:alpha-D-ribose 1-methylphosphonate 5-triphosphate synthase subunit PhnG
MLPCASMGARSCQVAVTDIEGVTHVADVMASSLYEAVALGLRAIRGSAFAGGLPAYLKEVSVAVASVRVEHKVQTTRFNEWLAKSGGSRGT